MLKKRICSLAVGLIGAALSAVAQTSSSTAGAPSQTMAENRAAQATAKYSLEYGVFLNGGVGTGDRSDYSFLATGLHAGKVLTDPSLSGFLRGQFEFAGDVMPWWQGRTPKFLRANCYAAGDAVRCSNLYPTGGLYNGVSITPVILRWNLVHWEESRNSKILPFVQGAGGLIWTNHKYPPVGPYQKPGHNGTSVFNFTPQFGIGAHYFVKSNQSITVQANAVHISSASLGDSNPGVNASVQFTIGYTLWK